MKTPRYSLLEILSIQASIKSFKHYTSITQSITRVLHKTAWVIPLYKDKFNKNAMSNFRPASVLSTFSKVYETVVKDQIVSRIIEIIESESEVVIDWFKKNKTVENPDNFQTIFLDKRKSDCVNALLLIISRLKLCHLWNF